ncbi:preprotein translocase subunit SecA [Paenisporosarcina sp. NPDC076898]|uniref:preprotein translocase subunit SecA n=1 Tax=unclassified Paenisporosarcina TaxID=2642018 RepID=UPI003CFECEB2
MFVSIKKMLSGETIELNQLKKIVRKINALENEISLKSDIELRQYTEELKALLSEGKQLEEIIPLGFAVIRESSKRVLGLRHYDVQLMGGAVLTQSQIAQMQTGEGKTLVATLPVYIMALYGKGVHVITANEYLASRDYRQMRTLFEFLGLTVGLNAAGNTTVEKQASYQCDITYGTGTEFGFDYLRDHLVKDKAELVQRPLFYALIDEVDSILIDEARTPLIIAGKSDSALNLFPIMAMAVSSFTEGKEYEYFPETKQVVITDMGADRLEATFGLKNVYDAEHREFMHIAMQSLRAKVIMRKDVDYIVKDGKILIVDPYTGRIMDGRTYSDGLHQAIEAKENVSLKEENSTQATVTIQHYFRLYEKIAGMTGSALPSKNEFWETYHLRVTVIPTNKENKRMDLDTLVYKTYEQKILKIVEEVEKIHATKRPVLIGTTSIEQSEKLSSYLKEKNINHSILNAKTVEDEAKIISEAGQLSQVMLATNMAGRGTDILLSPEVTKLGGLHIIGTELHNSARIDMQLRGRSGRQGDPGSTQFIISLEDELFYNYDEEEFARYLKKVKVNEDGLVLSPNPSKFSYKVQEVVEGSHFSSRNHFLKLDEVNNDQQRVMYQYREKALISSNMMALVKNAIEERIAHIVEESPELNANEDQNTSLINAIIDEYKILSLLLDNSSKESIVSEDNVGRLKSIYKQVLEKLETISPDDEIWKAIQQMYIETLDRSWIGHLDQLHYLREGIAVRGYAQEDPYRLYSFDALEDFNTMLQTFFRTIIRSALQISLHSNTEK